MGDPQLVQQQLNDPATAGATSFQTDVAPNMPVAGGLPAFATGELEQGIRPTRWDKFTTMMQQTSMDSPVGFMPGYEGAWSRMAVQSDLEGGLAAQKRSKISADEANKRYPGMPVPFSGEVYPEVADLMYSDQQRRNRLQAWVDRGPETGGLFRFGAMSTGALDPVNLTLGMLAGGASRALGLAPGLATTFGENLGVNLATEAPTYFQNKREHQDVSLGEAALSVSAGALLGTGIHAAIEGLGTLLGKTKQPVSEGALKTAIAQQEAGLKTDVSPSVVTGAMKEAGLPRPGTVDNPYRFQELAHPSERNYYVGYDANTNEPISYGKEYGPGIHGVDDGMVANNHAADPESAFTGRIDEVKVPEDGKFLDLGTPASDEEAGKFIDAAEKKLGSQLELSGDVTLHDFLDQVNQGIKEGKLPETALADVAGVAQEMGFDGYRYTNEIGGAPRSNGVMLFDSEKLSKVGEYQANSDITPSEADARAASPPLDTSDPASQKNYTPERAQEIQQLKQQAPAKEVELDPIVKAQEDQAKQILRELSKDDPELAAEIESLNRAAADDKQEAQALRDLAECMAKNIT